MTERQKNILVERIKLTAKMLFVFVDAIIISVVCFMAFAFSDMYSTTQMILLVVMGSNMLICAKVITGYIRNLLSLR